MSKERGMIFNGEMVRAILDGRKTQTRRIMNVQPSDGFHPTHNGYDLDLNAHWYTPGVVDKNGYLQPAKKDVFGVADENEGYTCPFGAVGDRIWVRETFATGLATKTTLAYRATHKREDLEDGWNETIKWTPSIHMPRWASRILLEITEVRVERLNDISEIDANNEGMMFTDYGVGRFGQQRPGYCWKPTKHTDEYLPNARMAFANLWESIYGEYTWRANPWVWVIEFKRVQERTA